jgi:hypothetical protein
MQKASEIRSATENIKYYTTEIKKLINEQFDLDLKRGQELGVNVNAGTIRYDALAVIYMDCGLFEAYLHNIESNLKSAESQDKILNKPEEAESIL